MWRQGMVRIMALLGVMVLVVWILVGTLLGSFYLTGRRMGNLEVGVLDLDGGVVGKELTLFVAAYSKAGGTKPTFVFWEPSLMDLESARREVEIGSKWGAVIVMQNSTLSLYDNLLSPESPHIHHDPKGLIYLIFDEGRQATIVGNIAIFLRQLLEQFSDHFSNKLVQSLLTTGANLTQYINHTQLLVSPVSYTEENLHSISPMDNITISIFLILQGIVSLISVSNVNGLVVEYSLHKKLSMVRYLLLVVAVLLSFPFVYAFSFSTIVYMYTQISVESYIKYWMWNYLTISVFMWNIQVLYLIVGPKPLSIVFFLYLVMNVSSAFSLIPLENSFYVWSYATPFYNSIMGTRSILFGVHVNMVIHSVALLLMVSSSWFLLPLITYLSITYKKGIWWQRQQNLKV